jgi:hypothetical protein
MSPSAKTAREWDCSAISETRLGTAYEVNSRFWPAAGAGIYLQGLGTGFSNFFAVVVAVAVLNQKVGMSNEWPMFISQSPMAVVFVEFSGGCKKLL